MEPTPHLADLLADLEAALSDADTDSGTPVADALNRVHTAVVAARPLVEGDILAP